MGISGGSHPSVLLVKGWKPISEAFLSACANLLTCLGWGRCRHQHCLLRCLLLVNAPDKLLLTRLLLSPPILTPPFRMGLEALVESYAFWRPSLRTLTFEDIPGIPKQGKSQGILGPIYSQFPPRSSVTEKMLKALFHL